MTFGVCGLCTYIIYTERLVHKSHTISYTYINRIKNIVYTRMRIYYIYAAVLLLYVVVYILPTEVAYIIQTCGIS